MPDAISGVSGANAAAATQDTRRYVTIRQPDGSTHRIAQPEARWDPATEAWVTEVRPEDVQVAHHQNRKYGQALDADDFMKLLVAQMTYQDPSNPADTTAMMQQTASMAMLERVNEMSTSAENMAKAVEKL
ncbi:MAG: flagellar hook capping FlgD N-terminal domain-containing protein, partial [Mobilicoccus sp.]|nr:flagellar hook capping FlgD N-terminal domain-containing protein [Mobilicoccus sp.]